MVSQKLSRNTGWSGLNCLPGIGKNQAMNVPAKATAVTTKPNDLRE